MTMLKDILSISGQPGLFKLVAEAKNSIIVESLLTGKRIPVYSHSKVSTLEDIAIFTHTEDIPLKEVFKKISENESGSEVPKEAMNDLKAYFSSVLPEYDKDRVYTSDMKKIIQWYNLLHQKELLNFEEEEKDSEENPEDK